MAPNGAEGSERSVLSPGHRTQRLQSFQLGMLSPGPVDRPQLGDGLTTVSDHERPALADLLQVAAETSLEVAGANGRRSCHVVMMTTWQELVKWIGFAQYRSN